MEKKVTIPSQSGFPLEITLRSPETPPKGVIQLNTGTCIPQRVYAKFAHFLTQHGYITLTYDFTDASNYQSEVTHESWLKDMASVFDFVLKEFPDHKKYIVGHSSGGQFIGYMPNAHKADKIFLVAASNGYYRYLPWHMRIVMLFFWKVVVAFSLWRYGYMNNKLFGVRGGFPPNIIRELRSWCFQPDFFLPYFADKGIPSYYDTITCPVKAYHLADDPITTRDSCSFILGLYRNANSSFQTLYARDYGMKQFGHRGFYFGAARKKLWPEFLLDLEQ